MMKNFWFYIIILLVIFLIDTNSVGKYFEIYNWAKEFPYLDNNFYKTKEAKRVGNNLLFYQDKNGGFPKNIFYPKIINEGEADYINKIKQNKFYTSIDNNATTNEIIYLAKLYNSTKEEKYKSAALKGIDFLLSKQHKNGSWVVKENETQLCYLSNITFNDNAFVNILKLLKNVSSKTYPFNFVDDTTAQKAKKAFENGIKCILKCQIKQNEVLTGWCAQHDKNTLLPVGGRGFEKTSISGQESMEIALLLISIENPSQEIINAIESYIKWLKKSQISGISQKWIIENGKLIDYKMDNCKNCPPLWGRFYEIDTNKVFFCDRDGKTTYDLNNISQERRVGYKWYNSDGIKVLQEYDRWKINIENSKL